MPLYTIETAYRVPIYRQTTYAADTVEEACELALQDDDWDHGKHDFDSASEIYVTGVWLGQNAAYRGPESAVPQRFEARLSPVEQHFGVLLELVKELVIPCEGAPEASLRRERASSAIARAEAILAGAPGRDLVANGR